MQFSVCHRVLVINEHVAYLPKVAFTVILLPSTKPDGSWQRLATKETATKVQCLRIYKSEDVNKYAVYLYITSTIVFLRVCS